MTSHVIYSPASRVTGSRMADLYDRYLSGTGVILNLGDGGASESANMINRPSAVMKCADKTRMFDLLTAHRVPCLTYFNLHAPEGLERARHYYQMGARFIFRRADGSFKYGHEENRLYNGSWDYCTIKEARVFEYRALCYKGTCFRLFLKDGDALRLKHYNTKFKRIEHIPAIFIDLARKTHEALGIDLTGLDVLLNEKGEFKIIEANSGPGMNEDSICVLFNLIRKEHGLNPLVLDAPDYPDYDSEYDNEGGDNEYG